MKNKAVTEETLRLLKTEEGYLHRDIDEGLHLEEDELNYGFTDNPFVAYRFYGSAPKYLGLDSEKWLKTEEDCCEFLNGKMVEVNVTYTTEWEEI